MEVRSEEAVIHDRALARIAVLKATCEGMGGV